jgi:outer membrane lipoprotein-sorting protein
MTFKTRFSISLFSIFLLTLFTLTASAQNPYALLKTIRNDFNRINDLKCKADMQFNIPGVKLERISGNLFYKKPGKFRVNANGLIFVPKQSPFLQLETLADTTTYVAVLTGPEEVNGKACHGVTVIPNNNEDLMVMKLAIGKADGRIHRAQLTLKREGTVTYHNTYASAKGILPSEVMFEGDFRKFKMPKALTGDIGGKTEKPAKDAKGFETGSIRMTLTEVELNRKISDSVFEDAQALRD